MTTVGAMQMPPDFRYRSVFLKGRPRHGEWDAFSLRHPAMDRGRRAKIFSPFDALKGFSEAVAAKDEIYVSRPEPGEEEREELIIPMWHLECLPDEEAARLCHETITR